VTSVTVTVTPSCDTEEVIEDSETDDVILHDYYNSKILELVNERNLV